MNKKFTFMVAALLAAGSVFATPTETNYTKLSNGKVYYMVVDADEDGKLDAGEIAMTSGKGSAVANVTDEDLASLNEALWKVSVSNKIYSFTNLKTGLPLAFGKTVKNGTVVLLTSTADIEAAKKLNAYYDQFTVATDNGGKAPVFQLHGYADNNNKLTVTDNANVSLTPSGSAMIFVNSVQTEVTVENLQKLGTGFNLDLAGTVAGEDLLQGLSVVEYTSSVSDAKDALNGAPALGENQFLLQVGEPKYKKYDLSNKDQLAAFKAAEFIVLTADKKVERTDAQYKAGYGFTYAKVKGSNLVSATTGTTEVKSGKSPIQNAIFIAKEDANTAGKIAIEHAEASLMYPQKGNDGKTYWTNTTGETVYLGIGGTTAAPVLTSSDKQAWATISLGTAVEVKDLVKGYSVVNILTSEDKNSAVMKNVLHATQTETSYNIVDKTTTENVSALLGEVYAQWVVSADKDANTVSFYNRETGATIANVTLFKTPKANVFTASGTSLFENVFVELRSVANPSQFDGYLHLNEDGLANEYTMSVKANDVFADYEVPVVADKANLVKSDNKDAKNVFTFKLAQSKDANSKLDTAFVNIVTYNYYKDGKFTTAKDTLKAIEYNFTALKNASKQDGKDGDNNVVTGGFALDYSTETSPVTPGKFMLRKSGSKYQIVKAEQTPYDGFVGLLNNKFTVSYKVEAAQLFTLNPVAILPSYDMPESHVALEINGAYLGSKADGNAIMTNDTSMLKSTVADAAFSFYAFSADKEEAKTPSYYLSSNGKMMNDAAAEVKAIDDEIAKLSPVFDTEKIKELEAKKAAYFTANKERLVKFQQAKYVDAEHIALAKDTVKGDALKSFKFNVLDVDGQAVLKNANQGYVQVLNDAVVFTSDVNKAAKFNVVAAEAPTSNEGVSATEVKVVANNGSVVVKNAAGKNVVVSTILGQVVANEVLTSDNATINVPAGIVVVAVEGESFKVNVK